MSLFRHGYRVSAICPGDLKGSELESHIQHYAIPAPNEHFWHGNRIGTTLRAIRQRIKNVRQVARHLKSVRPDIIICSEPDSWTLAVWARRHTHCKVIVDLQEFYEDRALSAPKGLQTLAQKMIRFWMRRLAKQTDLMIHVSSERQAAYEYLHQPGIIVGNYPRLSDYPVDRSSPCPRMPTDRIVFLHAGALRPSYASDQLLEALEIAGAKEPRLLMIVLGGAVGALDSQRMARLVTSGLLEIKDQVPRHEVFECMQKSDVGISLVLPIDTAHRLAAPQKLYEYMGACLPVLASDVPTLRRVIIEHDCGILVEPASPQSIANGLLAFVNNLKNVRTMGEHGRIAFNHAYNWEQQETVLCDAIDRLAPKQC